MSMSNDLGKTLTALFDDKYTIPLYQRNFAWRTEEIHQLLQDIYEACRKNPKGNYYIGSLVVMKRHNGDYEVIDGQQRLTVISLIAILLRKLSRPVLFYDSRPEVQEFFELLCKDPEKQEEALRLTDPSLYYLKEACEFLKTAKADLPDGSEGHDQYLADQQFSKFFMNKVILVRNEIPEDTDVAAYFEIMNNRGEQLQKHEIVKAQMMDKIKVARPDGKEFHDTIRQGQFAQIWDACSQMDAPIQRLFLAKDRESYFGERYDGFLHDRFASIGGVFEQGGKEKPYSLADIIRGEINTEGEKKPEGEKETETEIYDYSSIIDFPNFLMHVLRLYCHIHKVKTVRGENAEVPLNEKDLLAVYRENGDQIDSMKFIELLLFCRAVFDRFIVKTTEESSDQEDGRKWILLKPTRYESNWRFTNWRFTPSFEGEKGKQLVAALSMLQVTFRTRIYKTWLYDALKWFYEATWKSGNFGGLSADTYLGFLHGWMLDYYHKQGYAIPRIPDGEPLSQANSYSLGTATPHFLFNFIDYLYWCEWRRTPDKYKRFGLRDFAFKYWNSVEHHRAQNKAEGCHCIDNLGNLCLISKSSNSRLSDRDVKEKVEVYGKGNLGINRQIIYAETKGSNWVWGNEQIRNHYNEIATLLDNRKSILSSVRGFAENETNPVDLADNIDKLGEFIEQHFFDGITTDGCSINVIRKDDVNWEPHDEEMARKWCGRYFKIICKGRDVTAFVGWFYSGGLGGKSTKMPRFIIQIDKDRFSDLSNDNSTNWYEDSYLGQWMNKDILGDLRDIKSVAEKFKREIESLCDSK